jgi:hypothetical protein
LHRDAGCRSEPVPAGRHFLAVVGISKGVRPDVVARLAAWEHRAELDLARRRGASLEARRDVIDRSMAGQAAQEIADLMEELQQAAAHQERMTEQPGVAYPALPAAERQAPWDFDREHL